MEDLILTLEVIKEIGMGSENASSYIPKHWNIVTDFLLFSLFFFFNNHELLLSWSEERTLWVCIFLRKKNELYCVEDGCTSLFRNRRVFLSALLEAKTIRPQGPQLKAIRLS
jgi:hypothetical protein